MSSSSVRPGTAATIVVVGSANYDVQVQVERFPAPGETVLGRSSCFDIGGKGANQAVAVRRAGGDVRLVAAVGDDARGAEVLRWLDALDVDASTVRTVAGAATGTAHIMVDESGENLIAVAPGANSCLVPGDVDEALELIGDAGVVVVQAEISMGTIAHTIAVARRRGAQTIVNLAPATRSRVEGLDGADWLVVNEVEFAQLYAISTTTSTQEIVSTLAGKLPARRLVVTLGSIGALLMTDEAPTLVRAPRIHDVVDTTGAGDAFVGVLAAGVAIGLSPLEAVRWAVDSSSQVVSRRGAARSYPDFIRGETAATDREVDHASSSDQI
ncbi:MAG: ribokinase [Cellulomonadaceae bacterium]|nr:ribokinase [Cellulomonadaceae bacterium]